MDVQQIFALFIIVYLENFVRYVLGTSSFIPLEDSRLTTGDLIKKYGFPYEDYDIVTEDGHIIKLHRIPHGRNSNFTRFKASVILQHGLTGCSSNFLMSGPDYSIAYLLADAGYDVWIPDARGNYYSRAHTKLNPNFHQSYWDFSFHEIGVYDIPATIDFILHKTKQEKLFHIGHSQGNTVFYVMATERPEYNDKIIAHFSYAPSAYEKYMRSPIMILLVHLMDYIEGIMIALGIYEMFPGTAQLRVLAPMYCADKTINENICTVIIQTYFGYNWKEINKTLVAVAVGHSPAGASIKQGVHYGQLVKSGRFCQFDYGPLENMNRYNTLTPPDYNISKITSPMYLFYSVGDMFSDIRDVERFKKELPNVKAYVRVDDPKWTHLDFVAGLTSKSTITDKTIKYMNKYFS